MPRNKRILSLSLLSLTCFSLPLAVLAKEPPIDNPSASPTSSVRTAAGIRFSADVPESQYQALAKDLAELPSIPLTHPDSKLLSVMGLKDASAAALSGWLGERVHFIVGENAELTPAIVQENYLYPNPDVTPVSYGDPMTALQESDITTVMSNLGTGLYTLAKSKKTLISLDVPGVGSVNLTSPRVGMIKIGAGLFNDAIIGADGSAQFNNVRRAFHLTTIFHEAHHSDGNGAHMGFGHMICPEGHAYQGSAACDANLNGPYSVEAHLANSLDRSCDNCSAKEHDMLRMLALDAASRVQKEIVDPAKDPVAVVKQTQMLTSLCDSITEMELESSLQQEYIEQCLLQLPQYRAASEAIKNGTYKIPVVQSTAWDATPEGSFNPTTDVK
jgi:hypothetical protein